MHKNVFAIFADYEAITFSRVKPFDSPSFGIFIHLPYHLLLCLPVYDKKAAMTRRRTLP